jgi:hypothetical protein
MDHIVTQPAGNEGQHSTPGAQPAPVPHRHAPPEQISPVLQRCPHRPQLLGSLSVFTHTPLQHDWPGRQAVLPPHRQYSSEQVSPGLHRSPQAPQLYTSVLRFAQRSVQQ